VNIKAVKENRAIAPCQSMKKLIVVKIGGKMIDDPSKLNRILDAFADVTNHKILVHGGASQSDELLAKLGIEKIKVDGRRVTDQATLDVCVMVYAGLLNKQVVADLSSRGVPALGMSGADLNSIECVKRPVGDIDYGYVGDFKKVNAEALVGILNQGIAPVFSAITHDNNGQLLNTNGDTIAAGLANALADHFEVELQFVFDRDGVVIFEDENEVVISKMTPDKFQSMIASGDIKEGLIPKLENGFLALNNGIQNVRMGSPDIMVNNNSGTKLSLS